jgi:hypothetical protein
MCSIWWGNLAENVNFEGGRTGKIILRWILGKYVVRIQGGWN